MRPCGGQERSPTNFAVCQAGLLVKGDRPARDTFGNPLIPCNPQSKLAVFEGKRIRKVLHEGEWWFSIIDVVEVLAGSDRPRKYWNGLKQQLVAEGCVEVSEKIGQLKMAAPDGKQRFTDCANTETMFRIIQSIPSPKVERLKRYCALSICNEPGRLRAS